MTVRRFDRSFCSRLDYCGIAMLIMGSFVPWLYYGFYCHFKPKLVYLIIVCTLGITSIIVSLWDKFSESSLRPLRAGVFMTFGLSGIVPAIHYGFVEGWFNKISQQSLGWLVLMGTSFDISATGRVTGFSAVTKIVGRFVAYDFRCTRFSVPRTVCASRPDT